VSPRLVSAPLAPAFDLLAALGEGGAFLERDGLGVATGPLHDAIPIGPEPDLRGLAAATSEALGGIASADGAVPIAVGALPFGPGPASLAIPARAVVRTDDRPWLVGLVRGDEAPPPFRPDRVAGATPHDAFRPVQLTEEPSGEDYGRAVEEAVRRIGSSVLDKVVLARALHVDAGRTLDVRRLLHRLRAVEPHCYVFAAPVGRATLVGASPELLVSRRGRRVRSVPLAGTAPRAGDPEVDRANAAALAASSKEREEHAIVVDAVAGVLGAVCDDLAFDAEPVFEPTANVWHLATRFEGTLRDPAVTALDLVAALHPTPAICGTPAADALAVIDELEPFDRGAYAGPVGWVDARGDGEWAIALRCASIEHDRATLYAGAGIVAGSVAASEVDETERKFRAFLDSLRWG
jgi:isochorismate synthase